MEKKDLVESRRGFLKKAAYAVPAVVALGQITNPSKSIAGSYVGGGSSCGTCEPTAPNPNTGNDHDDARNIFGR